MRKEKIILSIAASSIGILVAVAAFFFYQSTKEVDTSEIKKITIVNPTPEPKSGLFLTVDKPSDEEVVDKRLITVSGKTVPDAKILIATQTNQEAAVAAGNGTFSTEITLDENENIIEISVITPNGETINTRKTVTFSVEDF